MSLVISSVKLDLIYSRGASNQEIVQNHVFEVFFTGLRKSEPRLEIILSEFSINELIPINLILIIQERSQAKCGAI